MLPPQEVKPDGLPAWFPEGLWKMLHALRVSLDSVLGSGPWLLSCSAPCLSGAKRRSDADNPGLPPAFRRARCFSVPLCAAGRTRWSVLCNGENAGFFFCFFLLQTLGGPGKLLYNVELLHEERC